ncbi:unnamed protein product [Discula destructiva]
MALRILDNRKRIRLLVLNPNRSEDMTKGMRQTIMNMDLPHCLEINYYTAPPDAPASINNQSDLTASTEAVWANLCRNPDEIKDYDAMLVACYSSHPLVQLLAKEYPNVGVTGIFEASVLATLPLLRPYPSAFSSSSNRVGGWGIVTTGVFWIEHLTEAVKTFLDQDTKAAKTNKAQPSFRGVFTTGLDANELHTSAPHVVTYKLKNATKELLRTGPGSDVDCVVMGCAGMAGLEDMIRSAIVEAYGDERAKSVCVVDGVRAGIGVLEGMIRNRRMFLPMPPLSSPSQ